MFNFYAFALVVFVISFMLKVNIQMCLDLMVKGVKVHCSYETLNKNTNISLVILKKIIDKLSVPKSLHEF